MQNHLEEPGNTMAGSDVQSAADRTPTNGLSPEDEDEDGFESLTARLNIEKRIQFGAEKFLEALDSDTSSIPEEARPPLRAKVLAELAASNSKIRNLEDAIAANRRQDSQLITDQRNDFTRLPQISADSPTTRSLRPVDSNSTLASEFSGSTRNNNDRLTSRPSRLRVESRIVTGRNNTEETGSFPSLSPIDGESLARDHRSLSQRSLTTESYYDDSSRIRALWPSDQFADDRYQDQMDEHVIDDLRNKARQNLAHLRSLKPVRAQEQRTMREVGGAIASLTRFARLSPQVASSIDFEDLVDVTLCYAMEPYASPLRSACYRLYRNFLYDRHSWHILRKRGVEWLLIRTFGRANRQIPEMEQALQLIRVVILLPVAARKDRDRPGFEGMTADDSEGVLHHDPVLSEALVRILVSMAENSEDPFQSISLETLAEIAVVDLATLIQADGLRFILQIFENGPYNLTQTLTPVLMSLLNLPESRRLLPTDTGLGVIFAGFTNAYGSGPTHIERLRATSVNTLTVLRSWPGFMMCCMSGSRQIESLVEALSVPVMEMREVLLDTLFDLFRLEKPSWYHDLLQDKQRTHQPKSDSRHSHRSTKSNVLDHYTSLLLAVFVESGLVEALVEVVEEQVPVLSRKATLLISELLALAAKLLPLNYAAKVQTLPRLFCSATTLDDSQQRVAALDALSSITASVRGQRAPALADAPKRKRSQSQSDPVERGQRQVEQVRKRLGMQMDDRQFQAALVESQVLYTKDHNKWNYDVLVEIIEGPLLNARRLEEAFRVSKFGRRLMTFFQPLYRRFSDIKRTRANRKWVKLGNILVTSLMSTQDGLHILAEDQLLRQIVDCFMELDQYAGHPNPQPYFSKSRMENTLSYGYFEMIHLLSKRAEGLKLLEKSSYFTCFYHLSELRSRDDLIRAIIKHLDYSSDGHARIILSKALTSSYMHTRIFATQRLSRLLEEDSSSMWALELLVTQLYDPAFEVCEAAAQYLETLCEDTAILEAVVRLRPTLDHLGEVGQCLLLRFLSTSTGFSYLRRADYIDREIDEWYNASRRIVRRIWCSQSDRGAAILQYRNVQYVSQIEMYLAEGLRPEMTVQGMFSHTTRGAAPPNFYAEITKTAEGCRVLGAKGHVAAFANTLRLYGEEGQDESLLLILKSALWALGSIGSTQGGLPFLEEADIVELVVELAEHSSVLSIRGTCFFVLGLIASTTAGCDILEEYGWMPSVTARGEVSSLCLPEDLSDFLSLPDLSPYTKTSQSIRREGLSTLETRLLQDVSNLGNYVLATQAMQNLARLRNRHRELFSSTKLYLTVFRMLSLEHYKQPVRAFVLDMFDLQLTGEVIAEFLELDIHYTAAPGLAPLANEPAMRDDVYQHLAGLPTPEPGQAPAKDTHPTVVRDSRHRPPAVFIAGFP